MTNGERSLHAAWYRGCTVILIAIAVTLTLVGTLMAACGASLWLVLLGVPLLPFAVAMHFWPRVWWRLVRRP